MSQLIAHVTLCSCSREPIALILVNPSHVKDLCCSLFLWQLDTHAAWGHACGAKFKLTAAPLTLSSPHKDSKEYQVKMIKKQSPQWRWLLRKVLHQEPIEMRQSSQLGPHSSDWILMGSYDVASSEAGELTHNKLIYFPPFSQSAILHLTFFMFYLSHFGGFL